MKQFLLFNFIIFLSFSAFTQPLTKDANTLLLLNFDNKVTGVDGEVPTQSQNLSYQSGMHGQALYISNNTTLRFDTTRNFNSQQGTFEFWVRPEGPGTALGMAVGGGLRIGVGPWTVMDVNIGTPGLTKTVTVNNIYETNTWYHLAFTWDSNTLKLYKNGLPIASTNVGYNLPVVKSPHFNIGSSHIPNDQLIGRIDELRISNKARSANEIYESFLKGKNIAVTNFQLADTSSIDLYKTWKVYMNRSDWWKTPKLISTVDGKQIELPNALLTWTVEDTTVAKLINGDLETVNYGTTFLRGKYQDVEVKIKVNVLKPFKEMEKLSEIDNFLLTPASCHKKLIPVVMVAYIPTKDGIYLDKTEVDQWFLEDLTLVVDTKKRIISIAKDAKFMLEEGSKFRGYKNPNASPYVGYKIVDIIFIYEPVPRNRRIVDGQYTHFFEQYNAMERINAKDYVNNQGVKEFWVAAVGHYSINGPESNMSSPKTGDISNSWRINDDLPIYDHTYIWYGINYSRVGNEAVHNHGHQIEAMLSHSNWLKDRNTDLFWKNYVGRGPNNERPLGRCGDTHHPPNATVDYDYQNTRLIESDIMDWVPAGGKKTLVNKETWEKFNFNWIKNVYFNRFGNNIDNQYIHAESFWYVTWMQSLPGFGNQIAYNPPTNLRSSNENSYDFEICSHSCDHKGHFGFKRNTIKVTPSLSENIHNKQHESGSRNSKFLTNWMDIIYDWDNFYNKGLYSDKAQPAAPLCKLSSTTLTISPETCGEKNSIIDIPVKVKNYKDIAGLQLKIKSFKNEIAEVVGVSNINPNSGLSLVDFAVVDKNLVLTYADAAKSIADDAPLFNVRVKLLGDIDSRVNIIFDGDIFALDNNGSKFRINLEAGTACIKVLTSSVSGAVRNISNKGLNNVQLEVKSEDTIADSTKTNTAGNYILPALFNNKAYNIFPTLNESLSKGIDISDLFLLRRHIQGVSLFASPYTYVAADMTRDKNVDISDLFILRRIMQGLISELPDKVNSWRFVPKSYVFPASGNPLAGNIPHDLNYNPLAENKVNQDFTGVKYGDLDHSAISFQHQHVQSRLSSTPSIVISDMTAAAGNFVDLELTAKNFTDVAVMQFSISWPKDKLELQTLPASFNSVIPGTTSLDQTELSQGKLGIIWETVDFSKGTTVVDKSVLYKLKFKILASNGNSADIIKSITPKPGKLIKVSGETTDLDVQSGKVKIEMASGIGEFEFDNDVEIFPNPTTGRVTIKSKDVILRNLTLLSQDSRILRTFINLKEDGVDISDLPPGIYILKIETPTSIINKKIVLVR